MDPLGRLIIREVVYLKHASTSYIINLNGNLNYKFIDSGGYFGYFRTEMWIEICMNKGTYYMNINFDFLHLMFSACVIGKVNWAQN